MAQAVTRRLTLVYISPKTIAYVMTTAVTSVSIMRVRSLDRLSSVSRSYRPKTSPAKRNVLSRIAHACQSGRCI